MTRPTTPAPDAASDDAATWRVEFTDGIAAMGTAHDYEDGTFAGHVTFPSGRRFTDEGISPEDAVRRAAAAYCHEQRDAGLPFVREVLRPGEPSRAELLSDLARLRAPAADVAAIEASASAATTLPWVVDEAPGLCGHDVDRYHVIAAPEAAVDVVALVPRVEGADADVAYLVLAANSVPTLLALLAATRERHAAEVAGARAAALREGAVRAASVCESNAIDCDLNAQDAVSAGDLSADVAWRDMATLARDIAADIHKPPCMLCGEPATCFGSYEGSAPSYGCDDCCGHGNEDGHCDPVAALATKGAPDV